jgi:phage protein D
MTEQPNSTTSPVFLVGGQLVRDLARDCIRLDVREGVEGMRRLEATFLAVGAGATGPGTQLLHIDGSTVGLGSELKVAIGATGAQRYVFDGTVSAVELVLEDGTPPTVVVLAEDALMKLRMTRRMRSWTQVSDGDLASSLAEEHGLQAEVDAPGPTYDVVQQLNQSDLAFLRERARLVQAELWATGQTLHFASRSARQGTELTLVLHRELRSVRLTADLSAQRSEVHVTGYDAGQRDVVDERAGADTIMAETSGTRTGPSLVDRVFPSATSLRVRDVALGAEEAQAWAKAEMLRRSRGFVIANGQTNGSADLVVGSRLTLDGVGQVFEGSGYYATAVRHTFDRTHGFRSRFLAERPVLNEVR